jgi:octanoyl-[GcvH]:protein N-octanoyltransferase
MNDRLTALPEGIGLPAELQLIDRTQMWHADALFPFALDELLCRRAGRGGMPALHLWRHPRAFVMGLRDSRLPQTGFAVHDLEKSGYSAVVRNSGGAAVPLDLGVVNVSLVLPKRQGAIDFRSDFELMYRLIGAALKRAGASVSKGEIAGSYCPGEYDVSIGGRKFCGIAQRRQQHAFVVQAFVVVEGSGAGRAAVAREFYRKAAKGAAPDYFPDVVPERMASLSELIGPVSALQFSSWICDALRESGISLSNASLDAPLPDEREIEAMIGQLRARYPVNRHLC